MLSRAKNGDSDRGLGSLLSLLIFKRRFRSSLMRGFIRQLQKIQGILKSGHFIELTLLG